MIALDLSDWVWTDNQIFQKFRVDFTILAEELLIGNDLISELGDLRVSPDVVWGLISRNASEWVVLDWHLCGLDELVLGLLRQLVQLTDLFVGVRQLGVGLNSPYQEAWFTYQVVLGGVLFVLFF